MSCTSSFCPEFFLSQSYKSHTTTPSSPISSAQSILNVDNYQSRSCSHGLEWFGRLFYFRCKLNGLLVGVWRVIRLIGKRFFGFMLTW